MNHSEEQDPAWDLMKHARQTPVSPTFSQDVLREVRKLAAEPDRSEEGGWFSIRWAGAAAAAAAIAIVGVILINRAEPEQPAAVVEPEPAAEVASFDEEITIEEFADELEELAFLSELMEVSDTSLLTDEDLAALLF